MRQETVDIYKFNELSDDAKQNALDWYKGAGFEYHWVDEWQESLKDFSSYFGLKVSGWEISTYRGYSFSFTSPDDLEDMAGVRLWKYLQANFMPLTEHPFAGFFGDESFLSPIRNFMARPDKRSFHDLMHDCLNAGFSDWFNDMEYQESDEYCTDHIMANEYEFTAEGKPY